MHCLVFPFEFKQIQANYPIFFHKDTTNNEFVALALLGFEKGENLFLKETTWDAGYIPAIIERDPFLIGFQSPTSAQEEKPNAVIHIDMDSPRVGTTGESVFLPHGGNTEYLNKIADTLKRYS